MTAKPAPSNTEGIPVDLSSLLAACQLIDVIFYEVGARRNDNPFEAPENSEQGSSREDEAVKGGNGDDVIQIMVRTQPGKIEVRGRVELNRTQYSSVVEAAAYFGFRDLPVEPDEPLRRQFTERVGLMVLYPYLREALHQEVVKLRLDAPLLPLLKLDDLEPMPEVPDQAVE